MERRTLGGSGLSVSRVCLGTMTFGGQTDEAAAASMLDLCLDRGVDFVDTANVYAGGKSEEILGRLLRGRRDRVVLATKAGGQAVETGQPPALAPTVIVAELEASLRRLQTDYVDLYYLHRPDYSTPIEQSLEALDRLVRAGKVRHVACSNYASWQVCQMLWVAKERGWQPMCVAQQMHNLLARGLEQEFLPMCREFGLSTVAYNPLAGGLLTGKHLSHASSADGTRFARMPIYRDRYWHDANFAAIDELKRLADEAGRTLPALALSWVHHHGGDAGTIIGASRLEQLKENLASLEQGPLPHETVAGCDAAWQSLRGVTPQYNR